jgi:hypothetical protein
VRLERDADVPVEVTVGFLATAVTVLAGAVAFLFRRHLDDDRNRDRELASWKAIAESASRNVGELVPSIARLTNAVESEHKSADDGRDEERSFRTEWRQLATDVRDWARDQRNRGRS